MVAVRYNKVRFTTEQLVAILGTLVIDYMRAVRRFVLDADAQGTRRQILGDVPGRERSEDEYVQIDQDCEDSLVLFCGAVHRDHGVRFWIRSEHFPQGYGIGCSKQENADVECDIDPFDGTDQWRQGYREAWWSVLSFSCHGRSLVGGAVDILGGVMYRSYGNTVEEIFIRANRRQQVFPRVETSLNDRSLVASYKGKSRYLFPWAVRVKNLFAQPNLAGISHSGIGGTPVYALLAAGKLSAYIMDSAPGEPISEISPGAGFVEAAGLCLLVVKGERIEPFSAFAGMEGRVDGIFIAAANKNLAFDIARQFQETA